MDALAYNRSRNYSVDIVEQIQRVVGVDPSGQWNDATVVGVCDFQTDHELEVDGKVGPRTLAAIQLADALDDDGIYDDESVEPALGSSSPADDPLRKLRARCVQNGWELFDYRDLSQWPRNKVYPKEYGYPRNKSRAEPPYGGRRRDWKSITTLMLHTTAVGGMTARRGVGIPCHLYLPKEPAVVLCHELELHIHHGHAANRFTVGLEISGVSDWDSPNQVARARALLRYFRAQRRAVLGSDAPCYVMAHRMSHATRGKDPGMRIWQDVGEWAIEELGFELGPIVGSGRSVDKWRAKSA